MSPIQTHSNNQTIKQRILFYCSTSSLGFLGGFLVAWQSGFNTVTIAIIFALTLLGFLIGFVLFKQLQSNLTELNKYWEQENINNEKTRQKDRSISDVEQSITLLSSQFSCMSEIITEVINTSQEGKEYLVECLLLGSQAIFKGVIDKLGALTETELKILGEFHKMSLQTNELNPLILEICNISEQLNNLVLDKDNNSIDKNTALENFTTNSTNIREEILIVIDDINTIMDRINNLTD